MSMRRRVRLAAMALAASLTISGFPAAQAHVVVMPETVSAGQPVRIILVVAEGCAGSPTTSLRVEIPPEITFVKPQPKSGWTIELTHERTPDSSTKAQRERIAAITWRGGPVPDDHYEEFALLLIPPREARDVYLPAIQTCEKGKTSWIETPTAKAASDGMEYPAPVMKVQAGPTKH